MVCVHSENSVLIKLLSWGFYWRCEGFQISVIYLLCCLLLCVMNKFFHCCNWEFCKYRKRSEPNSATETLEENFILQGLPYSIIWIQILCNVYSGNTVLISVGVIQDCKESSTKLNLFLEMTSLKLLSGISRITLLWLQLMFQVKIIVYTKVWWRAEINRIPGSVCDRKTEIKILKADKQYTTCLH